MDRFRRPSSDCCLTGETARRQREEERRPPRSVRRYSKDSQLRSRTRGVKPKVVWLMLVPSRPKWSISHISHLFTSSRLLCFVRRSPRRPELQPQLRSLRPPRQLDSPLLQLGHLPMSPTNCL